MIQTYIHSTHVATLTYVVNRWRWGKPKTKLQQGVIRVNILFIEIYCFWKFDMALAATKNRGTSLPHCQWAPLATVLLPVTMANYCPNFLTQTTGISHVPCQFFFFLLGFFKSHFPRPSLSSPEEPTATTTVARGKKKILQKPIKW